MGCTLDNNRLNEGVLNGLADLVKGPGRRPWNPMKIENNGKLIRTQSGYVQGGLWAAYPGVNSRHRVGNLILERKVLEGDRDVLIFSTEETDAPGTRPVERALGVIARGTTAIPQFAFSSHALNVLPEIYSRLGVVRDRVPNLLVDTEGRYRLDKLITAMLDEDAAQPDAHRLRKWLRMLMGRAWGGTNDGVIAFEEMEFAAKVYHRLLGGDEENLWQCWAQSQNIRLPEGCSPTLGIVTHWVPDNVFEVLCAAADQGWIPLLPQWQTLWGYMYNHDWGHPCTGGLSMRYADGYNLSYVESKLMSCPAAAGYTIHTYGPSNAFPYKIPTQWLDVYMAVMNELAATPAPKDDYPMMEGMLREAAQHIPTMVIGSEGDVSLYEAKAKIGDGAAFISATNLGTLDYREPVVPLVDAKAGPTLTEEMLNQAFARFRDWADNRRNIWTEQLYPTAAPVAPVGEQTNV